MWYDNLVMKVMEHDRPTNYEEEMVDLSPRNDYESYMIRDKKSMYDYQVNDLGRSS